MEKEASTVFNRRLLRKQRNRAAGSIASADFLMKEVAERLADRLDDMAREFPIAIDLGAHHGVLQTALKDRGKIHHLIQTDLSDRMIAQAVGERVVCDEEWLPFKDQSVDLVISGLSLQWVNDLPGTLIQIRRILKPDGLFLCILPGALTLHELRESLAHAEMALRGGISPRVAPMLEVRDAGALLQRAGFALPVVDSDMLQIRYPNALRLWHELRAMGAGNCLADRDNKIPPRDLFANAAAHYAEHHLDDEGHIIASVELLTLTAWSPHASQQQPAKRGSGQVSLGEVLSH
ncbi:MAG: methyltransferase domain-containing protein [Rickettsiales bacterium]|nr:methyltransferase domain-containing protein [Rickettsiales bacterium]